jgi:hypothetical protein
MTEFPLLIVLDQRPMQYLPDKTPSFRRQLVLPTAANYPACTFISLAAPRSKLIFSAHLSTESLPQRYQSTGLYIFQSCCAPQQAHFFATSEYSESAPTISVNRAVHFSVLLRPAASSFFRHIRVQ